MCARRKNPNKIEQARLEFMSSLNTLQLQWYHQMQEARRSEMALSQESNHQQVQATTTVSTVARAPKRQKKDSNKRDLDGRLDAMKAPSIEVKIAKLLIIEQQCPPSASLVPLTDAASKWVKVTLRPVLRCYRNHHGSDAAAFAAAWNGRFKADFAKHCCKGTVEACSAAVGIG